MKLFRRKKQALSQGQEQVAGKIAGKILWAQRRVADYLNAKTSGFSARVWLALLMVFCTAFGGYCFYLLLQVFN